MLLVISVLALLVSYSELANVPINTYTGQDGRQYYATPLYCSYSGSLLMTNYYNKLRSTYTARNNNQCCYLADVRSQCCLHDDGTCRCAPEVTCPIDTTTTASTTESTTTPTTTTTTTTTTMTTTKTFVSLCNLGFRVLNGDKVPNDCTYPGITNITSLNGQVVSCNAVYTFGSVNGTVKKTFLTVEICKNIIEKVSSDTNVFDISIGEQRYAISPPMLNMYSGPNGTAFIDVNSRYQSILSYLGPCQKAACPYNQASMNGRVNRSNCRMVSWGTSDAATLTQDGLYETALTENPGGCTNLPLLFGAANALCFKTVSGKNAFCSGDSGAPVYCNSPSNNEWILMGVVPIQTKCGASNEVLVLQNSV